MKVELVRRLRCVDCGCCEISLTVEEGNGTEVHEGSLECGCCHRTYPITNGLAILLPTNVLRNNEAKGSLKSNEMQYYSEHFSPKPEEEQNLDYGLGWSLRRPTLHTDMYQYYMNYIRPYIDLPLEGKVLLDVGCGSGKEAEFLARICRAQVVGLDVAIGAVYAALKRSVNFDYWPLFDGIVGDMECMPFQDKSVDICLTHGSLHHATNPFQVLSEMARTSKDGIIITFESVDSISIRIALVLGLTSEYEANASGNRVWRPSKRELRTYLQRLGLREITMRQSWLNTSSAVRWGKIAGRLIRPVTSFLECEFLLRLQDAILGPIGNTIFIMAKF